MTRMPRILISFVALSATPACLAESDPELDEVVDESQIKDPQQATSCNHILCVQGETCVVDPDTNLATCTVLKAQPKDCVTGMCEPQSD